MSDNVGEKTFMNDELLDNHLDHNEVTNTTDTAAIHPSQPIPASVTDVSLINNEDTITSPPTKDSVVTITNNTGEPIVIETTIESADLPINNPIPPILDDTTTSIVSPVVATTNLAETVMIVPTTEIVVDEEYRLNRLANIEKLFEALKQEQLRLQNAPLVTNGTAHETGTITNAPTIVQTDIISPTSTPLNDANVTNAGTAIETGNITNDPSIRVNTASIPNESLDDDVDDDPVEDFGRMVSLPWIDDGYDWIQLDPPEPIVDVKQRIVDCKHLPHNLCHQSNGVTDKDGRNYCVFLKMKNITEVQINNHKELIQNFRKKYIDYITELIYKFFFDISNNLEGFNKLGEDIRNSKQMYLNICRIRTKEECNNVLILLYIIFDFVEDHRQQISLMVQRKFNITIENPPLIKGKRRTLDFMIKLITQTLTNIRKNINGDVTKYIGIWCTITKTEGDGEGSRIKKKIYSWMIKGKFVSISFCFISILM
jgi:hypothetical protein